MRSPIFPEEEYRERLKKVRERIAEVGLEAIILTRPQNIYYVSGYRAAIMGWISPILPLIIPSEGELCLITRLLEAEVSKEQLAKDIRNYMDHEDPFQILAELMEGRGIASGTIGIEENFLSVQQLNRVKKALAHATFKDMSGLVDSIRITLSEREIECFKRAAEITNIGLKAGLRMIGPGLYPYEAVGEIHNAMYKGGQTDVEVSRVWLWSGPQGGLMHDSTLTRRIERNDLATIEVWGNWNQYMVGAQATLFVGKNPSSKITDSYKLVSDMFQAAREALKPGAFAGEIYDAANKVYRSMKGEDYWRRIGTNMGLTFGPIDIGRGSRDVIRPRTPFILQPLVTNPALITCCSTLLVTERGTEELTPPLLELMSTQTE